MNPDTSILVTRTGPPGQRLADRLATAGLKAIHYSPVRLVEAAPIDELRRRFETLWPANILLVPSPEALRRLAELVPPSSVRSAVLVVPGPGSAELARALGFTSLAYPSSGGTSERMLELPELLDAAGRRVLILAAAGGRRLLEQALAERGATVDRLHVYRREAVAPEADVVRRIRQATDLVTLLASGGALAGLAEQLEGPVWQAIRSGWVIAPSDRVAEQARDQGCSQVQSAGGADDRAMLEAMLRARMDLGQWVTL